MSNDHTNSNVYTEKFIGPLVVHDDDVDRLISDVSNIIESGEIKAKSLHRDNDSFEYSGDKVGLIKNVKNSLSGKIECIQIQSENGSKRIRVEIQDSIPAFSVSCKNLTAQELQKIQSLFFNEVVNLRGFHWVPFWLLTGWRIVCLALFVFAMYFSGMWSNVQVNAVDTARHRTHVVVPAGSEGIDAPAPQKIETPRKSNGPSWTSQIFNLMIGGLSFFVVFIASGYVFRALSYGLFWFFPVTAFAIREGRERYQHVVRARWALLTTI